MTKPDFDRSLGDVRRQLTSCECNMDNSAHIDKICMETFSSGLEWDGDMVEGHFESLSEYTKRELKLLSKFLSKSCLNILEIEGVKGFDWEVILNQKECELEVLRVTINSSAVLADLATALSTNTSLSVLELNYYHAEENSEEQDTDTTPTVEASKDINEIFFEALMPLQNVVLRGITPIRPSSSRLFDNLGLATACSWRDLMIEDCVLTQENIKWVNPCIANLEEIVINNCELSGPTIQVLSEAYLALSASKSRGLSGKWTSERRRKNPLKVLKLSNNDWLSPQINGDDEAARQSPGDYFNDESDLNETTISPRSCTTFLASWLDSLSNLVELDLSNNAELFESGGMDDLCGTVNHSIKRLSLRSNNLLPNDLHQIVNTFCWLEALDLSENPALVSNISILSQLEYLTEVVLENMIIYDSNETFEFERRISDEEFDWNTEHCGLTSLLIGMLTGENASFPDNTSPSGIRRRWKKPLERLNLSGNIIDKKTLQLLSSFGSLQVLILMGCQVNDNGVMNLFDGTNNCSARRSSLRELYLASNTIGDVGIMALAQSMKDQRLPLLKVLNLESNAISVDAFRVFVEEGLLHSNRLQYVQVSDNGAITYNQRQLWDELRERMEHHLLLNQAGRFSLFVDGNHNVELGSEEVFGDEIHTNKGLHEFHKKKISTNVWPLILENADSVYGTDALFHFLHKRPDLFLASDKPQEPVFYHPTPIKSTREVGSPNGVEEIESFLL